MIPSALLVVLHRHQGQPHSSPGISLHTPTPTELTACRRELERAIAYFGRQDPVPAARAGLQATLEDALAGQGSRTKEHP